MTWGNDGTFCLWSKDAKIRLKQSAVMKSGIVAGDISENGDCFAWANGNDWTNSDEKSV